MSHSAVQKVARRDERCHFKQAVAQDVKEYPRDPPAEAYEGGRGSTSRKIPAELTAVEAGV